MLEHPPIANAQEKSESLKPDFLAEVQSAMPIIRIGIK